jgi:hypothetical protein
MIARAAAAHRAALDSLFVGDQHVSATSYFQNTPLLGRLLAEWGEAPAGCLFLLPLWHPVLVAEQIGTLAAGICPRAPRHSAAHHRRVPELFNRTPGRCGEIVSGERSGDIRTMKRGRCGNLHRYLHHRKREGAGGDGARQHIISGRSGVGARQGSYNRQAGRVFR